MEAVEDSKISEKREEKIGRIARYITGQKLLGRSGEEIESELRAAGWGDIIFDALLISGLEWSRREFDRYIPSEKEKEEMAAFDQELKSLPTPLPTDPEDARILDENHVGGRLSVQEIKPVHEEIVELDEETKKKLAAFKDRMNKVQERPVYEVLTKEIILSLDDDLLVPTIQDTVDNQKRRLQYEGKTEIEALESLSEGKQAVYFIQEFLRKVRESFLDFYLDVSSGSQEEVWGKKTIDALTRIGALEIAELAKQADVLWKGKKDEVLGWIEKEPITRENDPFGTLDNSVQELIYEQEELIPLQRSYIRSHIEEFI